MECHTGGLHLLARIHFLWLLVLSSSIGDSKPSPLLYIDTAKRDHPQAQIPRACKHFQVFVFGKITCLYSLAWSKPNNRYWIERTFGVGDLLEADFLGGHLNPTLCLKMYKLQSRKIWKTADPLWDNIQAACILQRCLSRHCNINFPKGSPCAELTQEFLDTFNMIQGEPPCVTLQSSPQYPIKLRKQGRCHGAWWAFTMPCKRESRW